jgi:hypothetical protein
MAKKPTRINIDDYDESDIPENIMKEARERVIREAAMEIARREAGLLADDDTGPPKGVKRGPPASVSKEPRVTITLDLAEHSDRLRIDDKIYLHGGTYTVPQSLGDVMREMIARGWEHQREIDGKDRNAYRKQANLHLNPQMQGMASDKILESALR